MTLLVFMDIAMSEECAFAVSTIFRMIWGFSEMRCPITVISATGVGWAISTSSSVAKTPVINVPSLVRSP